MGVLLGLTAMSAISAIETFTSGAILGATLYVASRTNKVNTRQPKISHQNMENKKNNEKEEK